MPGHEAVVAALVRRGELWEPARGCVALRGSALALYTGLERAIAGIAATISQEEWRIPPALSLCSLRRADYFASFPHWLTVAAHLSGDDALLGRVAASGGAADAVHEAIDAPELALSPAACYHVYERLAGHTLPESLTVSVQGTCWRHERAAFEPLLRGWAFTMREVVCVGDDLSVARVLERGVEAATAFAASLGLGATLERASDPFFAPTARGKALLQRVKALKRELLLPCGEGECMAASSFNRHETFFGDAFDIRLESGQPAASGCVAFGVERWMLAVLCAHGVNAANWPQVREPCAIPGAACP